MSPEALSGITVLVLDDNAATAGALVTVIEFFGGVAFSATTIVDAKRLLVVKEPDVAIVDFLLLNGHGLSVIDEFKAHKPRLACVLTSGLELPPGFEPDVPFLPKPFEMEQVPAKILEALSCIHQPESKP